MIAATPIPRIHFIRGHRIDDAPAQEIDAASDPIARSQTRSCTDRSGGCARCRAVGRRGVVDTEVLQIPVVVPIAEAVEDIGHDYSDRAAFVHVEVWNDIAERQFNAQWRTCLTTDDDGNEPWVILIDTDGIVAARWDNVLETDDDLISRLPACPDLTHGRSFHDAATLARPSWPNGTADPVGHQSNPRDHQPDLRDLRPGCFTTDAGIIIWWRSPKQHACGSGQRPESPASRCSSPCSAPFHGRRATQEAGRHLGPLMR
ncbi:MAG: hypothetical protein ACLGHQ_13145 [Acidimicrobiia bacterium]